MCPKDIMQRKRILRALEKAVGEMPELEKSIECERKKIEELEKQELDDSMAFVKATITTIIENEDNGRRCLNTINFHFRKENKDPNTTDLWGLEGHYADLRDDDYKKFEEDLRVREEKAAKK